MRRHSRWVVVALVGMLSTGWVAPLYLAAVFFAFGVLERLPGNRTINSFPNLEFASKCLAVAAIWLFLVVVAWASTVTAKLLRDA